VKERRSTARRASGIAGSVAAAVRRRQQAREPRILLYDATGEPRLLRSGAHGYDEVLAAAELLVELVADPAEEGRAEEGATAAEEPEF